MSRRIAVELRADFLRLRAHPEFLKEPGKDVLERQEHVNNENEVRPQAAKEARACVRHCDCSPPPGSRSRFSLAVVPRFSFRAPDVIEVLDRFCGEIGYPASIRVDQGSECVSRELDL